jgi:hypothetical protein
VEHLEPVIYGLVRAGRFDEAFSYLKVYETGQHGLSQDLVAAINELTTPEFPFGKWIEELLAKRIELQVSQWDTLRIMFAACAKQRGLAEASALAAKLADDEFAAAQVGIAQGLRNGAVSPPNTYQRLRGCVIV